jgi:UDP-glucose-4-epimerase GalE
LAVLVAGGAGYIGAHTVRLLQLAGRDVVVYDNLEFGSRHAVPEATLVIGDIGDVSRVRATIRKHNVDSVIHFAGYKAAGESMHSPSRYFDNNVAKSHAFLQELYSEGVRRIVFSSSCSVYGTPEFVPVTEESFLRPESPYGESKLMFERILEWFDRCHAMRSVSLRYFNAAGASHAGGIGEDWTMTSNLIPLVMKAVLGRRGPVEVFGTDYPTPDGTAIRDYVHVDDLASAHLLALEYLEHGGATTAVNLGTGIGSSVKQIVDTAGRVSGRPVPLVNSPRRLGDPVRVFADNALAKAALGWTPKYGLDEVVETAWAWHSTHLDGYAT